MSIGNADVIAQDGDQSRPSPEELGAVEVAANAFYNYHRLHGGSESGPDGAKVKPIIAAIAALLHSSMAAMRRMVQKPGKPN